MGSSLEVQWLELNGAPPPQKRAEFPHNQRLQRCTVWDTGIYGTSITGTILNTGICAEKINDSNDWISSPFVGQVASNSFALNSIEPN